MVNDFLKKYVRLIICFICFASSTVVLQAQTDPALLWAKGIGNLDPKSPSNVNFVTKAIKLDSLGNRYITGSFTGLADFDPGPGSNLLRTGTANPDIFLAKYDSLGKYVWAKSIGGVNADIGNDLVLDKKGNIYLLGSFKDTVDFDPGASTANLIEYPNSSPSISVFDIFLAKYDNEGNYLWAKSIGGLDNDVGNSMALDSSDNVVITGRFGFLIDFDPGSGTANLDGDVTGRPYFAKYDSNGNYLFAKLLSGTSTSEAKSVAIDNNGNIFLTGTFNGTIDLDLGIDSAYLTSASTKDIFIAKYDDLGNYKWGKRIGGSYDDVPNKIVLDANSNLFITGYFQGTVDFNPALDVTNNLITPDLINPNIFIAKYDSSGNYVWADNIGGTGIDKGNSLALDTSGNVFVTGSFTGMVDFDPSANTTNLYSVGGIDIYIAKYDSLGNYLWAKSMGGAQPDEGSSLAVDKNGNVVALGYFLGNLDFDPGAGIAYIRSASISAFIANYTTAGSYISASSLGGYNLTNNLFSQSIEKDANGNIYATGYFTGQIDFDPGAATANLYSNGGNDIFIAKYDSIGNYLWANGIGGAGSDIAYSFKLSNKGNIYIGGAFVNVVDFDPGIDSANLTNTSAGNTDIFFAKYDAAGNYKWANRIGKTLVDQDNAMTVDENENVFLTGFFQSTSVDFDPGLGTAFLSAVGNDIFIAKYDSSGNYKWAKNMGGSGSDRAYSISLDRNKNVLVTGFFSGPADFDPSASTVNLTSTGATDIFIAKYDSLGIYKWAKKMGSSTGDTSTAMIVDAMGNSYITGNFTGTASFGSSSTADSLKSTGSTDIFIAKYDSLGIYKWAKRIGSSGYDGGTALAFDSSGNLLLTGFFSGTADFNPGSDVYNLASAGSADIFLAKYDSIGNFLFAKAMGGIGNDCGKSVVLNNSGNILLTGYFANSADFDPGVTTLTSISGNQYGFIAVYGIAGSMVFGLNKYGQQTSTSSEFINKNGAVGLSGIRSTGENIAYAPTLAATTAVTDITTTSATSGGNIGSDNGSSVTARGVCWSLTTRPTTANNKTTDGNGIGTFTSAISGLASGTTYYVRSYATNAVGTIYGQEVSFTTL